MRIVLPAPWAFPFGWPLLRWLDILFCNITLWVGRSWYPQHRTDSEVLLSVKYLLAGNATSSLDVLDDYAAGYGVIVSTVSRHSLAEIHGGLRNLLPAARAEFHWGMIDALADALRTRNGATPVL